MNEAILDFQEIHTEFRPKILRYLTRKVGELEAEDLTQEVFVKVNQALPNFRGESKLSTWIYRIAANTALDRMRSPAYRRTVSLECDCSSWQGDVEAVDEMPVPEDSILSPEQEVFRKQRLACYEDCVNDLPESYRQVMVLSEFEEKAINEIADILGLSEDAVKMRLHRGKEKLLQILKCHCKAEDWL
ncbi:MAG: sigma-70 family RNA polymerase sigma factor [Leptolinea sp.]|nr:sigma-70 family RNA polymerase sigma factor [Leptolinea sp.]